MVIQVTFLSQRNLKWEMIIFASLKIYIKLEEQYILYVLLMYITFYFKNMRPKIWGFFASIWLTKK